MKKILSLLIVFSLLASLLPQPAHALGNPVNISSSSADAIYPQVVSDSIGYLHTVWMEFDQSSPSTTSGIFYSRWNGDTWSAPLKISQNTGFAEIPTLTVDSSNTLHVVWDDDTYGSGGLPRVAYITRTSSGTWSSIETLPLPAGALYGRLPNVAIDSSGNPNVVFHHVASNFQDTSIYWTQKIAGSWTTPTLVSTNVSGTTLNRTQWSDIAQDASGNLHVVYWDTNQGIFYRKYTGTWSTPVLISNAANLAYPRLAVTPSGEVFVTYIGINDNSVRVRWTQSGVWQSETTLSSSVSTPYFSSGIIGVTTDSSNRAHVGWGERDGGGLVDIRYRSFTGGTWQAVQDVDLDNNDAMMPFVYPDLWDNQHFVWSEKNPTTEEWEIKYRVSEGTIQTLSTTGGTITANPFGTTQVTLTVPNGALSSSTQIGIQVGPVPENVNPNVVTIPKAYTFRPSGLVFNSNATARIFYTNAEVAGADETQLAPWLWDSQTGTWAAQTVSNRNTGQNWMEVSLSHFSLYGIAAPKVLVSWNDPKLKDKKLSYSFKLSYADGSDFRKLKNKVDDLTINIKNSSGNTVLTLEFDDKNGPKQGKGGNFSGDVDLKKVNLQSGSYTVETLLNGSLLDTTPFSF